MPVTLLLLSRDNDLLGFLYEIAELVVQAVGLLEKLLADAVEVCLPAPFGRGVDLVLEVVEEVDGLVEEVGKSVVRNVGIAGGEEIAVIHERAEHVLDVLFYVT